MQGRAAQDDASFHAFQQVAKLVRVLVPKGYQLTKEQADAVHACAEKLAKDLTSDEYVYTPRP